MRSMTSPLSMPARHAGEPSMGVALGFLLELVVLVGIHEARVRIQDLGQPAGGTVHQLVF